MNHKYDATISDDDLVRKYTAFESMDALLNAPGGYFPSLHTQSAKSFRERGELGRLADAYDAHQEARGDERRAFRS